MDDWKLEERDFKLGNDTIPNLHNFRFNNTIETFPKYEHPQSKIVLKVSDNKQYAAVYDTKGYYCEFYEQFPDTHIRDNKVFPYNKFKYLFTLKRDTYRQEHFLVAFVTQEDGTIRLIFNSYHSSLTVYEMPTGKIIYEKVPIMRDFLGHVCPLTIPGERKERYWFSEGWWWGPCYSSFILDTDAISKGKMIEGYISYDEKKEEHDDVKEEVNEEDDDDDDDDYGCPFTGKEGTIYYKYTRELVFDSIIPKDNCNFFKYVDKDTV